MKFIVQHLQKYKISKKSGEKVPEKYFSFGQLEMS